MREIGDRESKTTRLRLSLQTHRSKYGHILLQSSFASTYVLHITKYILIHCTVSVQKYFLISKAPN